MSDVDRGVEMNASSGSFTSPEEANSPCNVRPSLDREEATPAFVSCAQV